jgi:predicted phosphoribosyltransferase
MVFVDRRDAGRRLAEELERLRGTDPVVLGLPRGGVVVAAEVADRFAAPLDVIVVRKLGVPWQPELAMGALGEGGARVLDPGVLAATGVTPAQLAQVERQAAGALADRVRRLRGGRPGLSLQGRTVWIVDDGIATGSTVRAACAVARERGAARIVVAVPVGPFGVAQEFAGAADEVVCLESPRDFHAVGQAYRDFGQTTDAEVAEILAERR